MVFGESNLSGEFEVGAAGTIDMPLIGSVPAMGVTIGQLQSDVTTRLRNGYLNDPKVSVQVLNYRPYFITGEVQKTGEFPYKAGLTVQDAIGVAGGYTYRANTGRVYIRRAGAAQEVSVDLTQRHQRQSGRQHSRARTVLLKTVYEKLTVDFKDLSDVNLQCGSCVTFRPNSRNDIAGPEIAVDRESRVLGQWTR